MAMILAGHYASERFAVEFLAELLGRISRRLCVGKRR